MRRSLAYWSKRKFSTETTNDKEFRLAIARRKEAERLEELIEDKNRIINNKKD